MAWKSSDDYIRLWNFRDRNLLYVTTTYMITDISTISFYGILVNVIGPYHCVTGLNQSEI